MRILITNDDGIDAPGLQALCDAAATLGDTLVVAPEEVHSGCGHQVTTASPLRLRQAAHARYALSGTPADCVRVALSVLDSDIGLVLSGINSGGNMGHDIYISGTVAAAREAAALNVPAIALSQYIRREVPVDWERTTRWARAAIEELLAGLEPREPPGPAPCFNVNFPSLAAGTDEPPRIRCDVDRLPLPVRYSPHDSGEGRAFLYDGVYRDRPRTGGRDVDHCMSGRVSVSELRI